ncbi:fucose permease [Actinokineospora auranticolor]|uniref:Fucose permease n=1 Tax=Actinokineospora auranticolor TaxID=155976 RepID=A0A2S6GJJ2_9PSEU|nr:fucose permease [Actinokineospora auranticolor]
MRRLAAFGAFLAFGAVVAGLGAALPFLRDHYDLGPTGGGAVVSVFSLGALVAIAGCGIADRLLPPRATMSGLLAAFVLGLTAAGLAPSWPLLLVAVALTGIGYGGLAVHLNAAFARGDRGLLMINLLNATFGAGAVLGPVVVAVVARFDVRWFFLIVALLAALCYPVVRCDVAQETDDSATGVRTTLLAALPFALIAFLYAGVETTIGAWESTYLTWTGIPAESAAGLTALFWAGLAVGRVIIPFLARRPAVIVLTGFAVAAAGLGLAAVPGLAVAGHAVAGLGLAPVIPTVLAWLVTRTSRARLATSAVILCSMLGGAVHPSVIGALANAEAPAGIPLSIGTYAVLGLLATVWAARTSRGSAHADVEDLADPGQREDALGSPTGGHGDHQPGAGQRGRGVQ